MSRDPRHSRTTPVFFPPEEETTLQREVEPLEGYVTHRRPVLVVLEGGDIRRVYVLDREQSVIGRGPDCHIPLSDASCSRRHACVGRGPDGNLWLEDLGSTNGTFVNGVRLAGRHALCEHDKVRIGSTLFGFHLRDEVELAAERRLVQLATLDPLTGLLNRGTFHLALEREYARAIRYNRPLSLLLVDLDFFKAVNDRWGHPVGDQVLAQVAQAIRGCLRHLDLAARHGGDEFVILLGETDKEGAAVAAERVREAIGRLSVEVEGEPVKVTASVGVVTAEPGAGPEAMMAKVDGLLYGAKNLGRNRVVGGPREVPTTDHGRDS